MQGVQHYENFPVASWLCPARLRPPIVAIYHFARTADDLADEGQALATERLQALANYRSTLEGALCGAPPPSAWPAVFTALQQAILTHRLPAKPLHDLLDAFEQDVRYTAEQRRYPDMPALLAYCERSANPVGRLLLHLYGVTDDEALQQSDAICSALQLINFWQDLSVDLLRQRHYLPTDVLQRHGVHEDGLSLARPLSGEQDRRARAMVAELCAHAGQLMRQGASLAGRLPGRMGWELRLVVAGGLRILEKIADLQYRTWQTRPRLQAHDMPHLLWQALRHRRTHAYTCTA